MTRRGAALLIVLASLVLVTSTAVVLVNLASTARLGRSIDRDARLADDLLRAVEPAIQHWLVTKAPSAVLPPDALSPELPVLEHVLAAGRRPVEVRVTAWDQGGMVPFDAAQHGSPLRADLPEEIKRLVELVDVKKATPGLDLYVGKGAQVSAFPRAGVTEPSVGSRIATHNDGWINVNTAPIDLVEAALRLAGRGGIEQIIAARAEGRQAVMGDLIPLGEPDELAPRLVARSSAWAFRIDVRAGLLRRSWWAVYQPGERPRNWECVQRLAIPE